MTETEGKRTAFTFVEVFCFLTESTNLRLQTFREEPDILSEAAKEW